MELISKRRLIETVAEQWKERYFDSSWHSKPGEWPTHLVGIDFEEIYNRLRELPETVTEAEIVEITGEYLTFVSCDECGQEVDMVVVVGEEPGMESSTASICPDCLSKAMSLILEYLRSTPGNKREIIARGDIPYPQWRREVRQKPVQSKDDPEQTKAYRELIRSYAEIRLIR